MKLYRLPKQGFPKVRRQILLQATLFVTFFFATAIGVGLLLFKNNSMVQFFLQIPWFIWAFTIPLSLIAMSLGFYLALRSAQENWNSALIEVDDNHIARRQVRINEIRIMRSEVKSVVEFDKGLAILTADRFRSLMIPKLLDPTDYDEIRNVLATWTTIEKRSARHTLKRIAITALAGALVFVGLGVIVFSSSPWAVLLAGLGLTVYYGHVLWLFRQTKGMDPNSKRVIALCIAAMAIFIIIKVLALYGGYEFFMRNFINLAP